MAKQNGYLPSQAELDSVKKNGSQMQLINDYSTTYVSDFAAYCTANGITTPTDEDKIKFFYSDQFFADGTRRTYEPNPAKRPREIKSIEEKVTAITSTVTKPLDDTALITSMTASPENLAYINGYSSHYSSEYEAYRKSVTPELPDTTETKTKFFISTQYDEYGNKLDGADDMRNGYESTFPTEVKPEPLVIARTITDPNKAAFVAEYCNQNSAEYQAYKIAKGITTDNPADQAEFFYQDAYNPDNTKKPDAATKISNVTTAISTSKEPETLTPMPKAPGAITPVAEQPPNAKPVKFAKLPIEKDDGDKYINGRKHVSSPKWLLGLSLILSFVPFPFVQFLALVGWGVFAALETDFFQHILPPKIHPTAVLEDHQLKMEKNIEKAEHGIKTKFKTHIANKTLSKETNKINTLESLLSRRDTETDPKKIDEINAEIAKTMGHYKRVKTGVTPNGIPIYEKVPDKDWGAGIDHAVFVSENGKNHHDETTTYAPPYDEIFNPYRDATVAVDNIPIEIEEKKKKYRTKFSEKLR